MGLVLLLALAGCSDSGFLVDGRFGSARLGVRPAAPTEPSSQKGTLPLGGDTEERGVLLVPQSYEAGTPAPLVVLFHGAGGSAEGLLALFREHAEASGSLVLAPKSVGHTWDLVNRGYGPDVAFLDQSLARVFREYSVDPKRVTISGFSDGASYALSLGLTNGDLFQRVAAFSPGFVAASELNGKPSFFIAHGTRDEVLPIDTGGRFIAHQLEHKDYPVELHEFDGPHTVPPEIARDGFAFLAGSAAP